jgi:hypothetical protein
MKSSKAIERIREITNLLYDGYGDRDGRAMILDHIEKSITTNVRWDECAAWMGM